MSKAWNETIQTPDWVVQHRDGKLNRLCTRFGGTLCEIPLRHDAYAGACWLLDGREVPLTADKENDGALYTAQVLQSGLELSLSLRYAVDSRGRFVMTATLQNKQATATRPFRASMRLGFDTYLEQYPAYNDQLFPTLLRCEKTHLWGYFSSPSGRLLTLSTDAPTASYTLDYEKNAQGIFTATLDFLQPGRLPARHPQELNYLAANETKEWNVALAPVASLYDIWSVKPLLASTSRLPLLHADRYTLAPGEDSRVTVFSTTPLLQNTLLLTTPDGTEKPLTLTPSGQNAYEAIVHASEADVGLSTLTVRNQAGYQAEMHLSVRRPWSWYLQMARKAAIDAPQKASSHAESWYGFYSAYWARRYFPDPAQDAAIDRRFAEVFPLLYESDPCVPLVQEDRIQNHSSMLGVFVARYECTHAPADLEQAQRLAALVLSFQREDGGFYKGATDYTSVIYPAKSIMELTRVEMAQTRDESLPQARRKYMQDCAEQHMQALCRAMEHLADLDGNFQTEGATASCYEDGANSCSATQLSEFALFFPPDSPERIRYTEAARRILEKHTSHEQALVPDSRMVGGTLRYWEAQYDVEMGGTDMAPRAQMMDSPHGWSAWNMYALFHLYELTGELSYLRRGMNAMGACTQLMSFDGTLRWAFVPDPYRQTRIFVSDTPSADDGCVTGRHEACTLGETYVPMISTWWKAPPHTLVSGYTAMGGAVTQGSACDNDVHEVFKAMSELVLTKAYVAEDESGCFVCYNASAVLDSGVLTVFPAEAMVSTAVIQLRQERTVTVQFQGRSKTKTIPSGKPQSICTADETVFR